MESTAEFSNLYEVSEIELVYKSKVKASQRPKIQSSREAYNLLVAHWNVSNIDFIEEFKIILLSQANRVLGIYEVSKGGVTGTIADSRLIFAAALKVNANAIILSHNHPSGQLQASDADKKVTEKMRQAGEILEIRVLDHLIVTSEGYLSFSDEGML